MAIKISGAKFIDALLDKWVTSTAATYVSFDGLVTGAVAGAGGALEIGGAEYTHIKDTLKKLFLVFHMPQYKDITSTPLLATKFESSGKTDPTIVDSDRIFNYIYDSEYVTPVAGKVSNKVLLSTNGITKKNMIILKTLLDTLVISDTAAKCYEFLLKAEYPEIDNAVLTRGGNTTDILLPNKIGGNKQNNNKSNKKVKKIRKRNNKSSKSLR